MQWHKHSSYRKLKQKWQNTLFFKYSDPDDKIRHLHSFNSCLWSFCYAPSPTESVEVTAINQAHTNHCPHGTPSWDFPGWEEPLACWSSLKPVYKSTLWNTQDFCKPVVNQPTLQRALGTEQGDWVGGGGDSCLEQRVCIRAPTPPCLAQTFLVHCYPLTRTLPCGEWGGGGGGIKQWKRCIGQRFSQQIA